MSPLVQWLLVVLGAIGAAGTWVRALVALREHRAEEGARRVRAYDRARRYR